MNATGSLPWPTPEYKHAINPIASGAAPLDGRSARLVPAPALAGDGDEEAVS